MNDLYYVDGQRNENINKRFSRFSLVGYVSFISHDDESLLLLTGMQIIKSEWFFFAILMLCFSHANNIYPPHLVFFLPDAATHSDIHLRGEIGGNLTVHCPVDNLKSIHFFYFQKNNIFINGFHKLKKIPIQTWSNTKMDDKDMTTVHIFNLNASHGGYYECHVQYNDFLNKTVIKVSVTGKNFLNLMHLKFNTVFHSLSLHC